jgi:hypothetical protein
VIRAKMSTEQNTGSGDERNCGLKTLAEAVSLKTAAEGQIKFTASPELNLDRYPTFNGTSCEDFYAEYCMIQNALHHTSSPDRLCLTMKGTAALYAARLPEETRSDHDALVKALSSRFGKQDCVFDHFEKLIATKWKGGADLQKHVEAIKDHVDKILDEDNGRQRLITCAFVSSIQDTEVKTAVAKMDKDTPIQQLIKIANVTWQARALTMPKFEHLTVKNEEKGARQFNNQNKPRNFTCYTCGKYGHVSKNCRSKIRSVQAARAGSENGDGSVGRGRDRSPSSSPSED